MSTTPVPSKSPQFDQPIILKRSPLWSRLIIAGILGVTAFSLLWACFARIDEAVSATGKLEPQGAVQDVKVPLNGVVKAVHVKDGQRVKQGDRLLTLDQTAAEAQRDSLKKTRAALIAENQFYRGETGTVAPIAGAAPKPELAALTKSRSALQSENTFYRAQLSGSENGASLTSDQQLRLKSSLTELDSRLQTARLDGEQIERQLAQTQVRLASAKETLKVSQDIYDSLATLAEQGAAARLQVQKQRQELLSSQAQVNQLVEEQERLRLAIDQSHQKLQNTAAVTSQDVFAKITDNEKRIAEIDSQLQKAIGDNEKRVNEIDSQMSQAQVTLQYQEIRSPVDGVVFDLKPTTPGFVANSTEPILKIVPDDSLIAEVFITNKDIGFVREKMPVDIRIDSFPFSEFGDVKGTVVSIGSDALPPTQIRPFYSFPAKVRLDRQSLSNPSRPLPLQSGMAVSANIKVRDRTIMSIFTDGFSQKVDSFKSVR